MLYSGKAKENISLRYTIKLILSKLQHVNKVHLKPADYQRGTNNRLLPNVIWFAPAFVLPLAFATAGRHIKATYFITLTYSINQFLEALNVCDSITNQQIDTAILLMPLSCLFHNAAALIRRGPVYLSAFRSCDHIYSAHEPLCSPVSQQQIQLSLVVCKTI